MNRMLKQLLFGMCVSLIAGSSLSVAAENAEPIKVGTLLTLSGPFEYYGVTIRKALDFTVDEINSEGGVLGRPVELIYADVELNGEVAAQKATELIVNEGIEFLLTGTGSNVGLALLPIAQEHKVLLFGGGFALDDLTGKLCNRYYFRTGINTTMQANALAFWVVMNGYKKVFGIAQDYSFGRSSMSAFVRKLRELDPSVELVGEVYHPFSGKDLRPYLQKIMAAEPDIVVTPNWGADLITLINQAAEVGLKTKFAGSYLNDSVLFNSLKEPDILLGSFGIDVYTPAVPLEESQHFVERFHQKLGEYPPSVSGVSYITLKFWAEAVKAAGTTDVEAVIDAWEGLIYDGPAGKWYMRPCDHQAQFPMWVGEIVEENPFFDHHFAAEATTVPVRFFTVPCEQTGCPGLSGK